MQLLTKRKKTKILTIIAAIINEHHLMEQVFGSCVDDGVNGPHQRGPALVEEHQNHTGRGEIFWVMPELASRKVNNT